MFRVWLLVALLVCVIVAIGQIVIAALPFILMLIGALAIAKLLVRDNESDPEPDDPAR